MDQDVTDAEEAPETVEPNAFGAFDRLVVNAALVAASIIPTAIVGLLAPWKLAPLIWTEEPNGRRGLLLSPGLFFVVAIVAAVLLAGAVRTPPPSATAPAEVSENVTFFGKADTLALASAVAAGDFSKALLVIAPLFLLSVFSASVSIAARPLLGSRWTLSAAIRAWLYFMAIAVGAVFVLFALLELINSGNSKAKAFNGDVPMLLFLGYFFASIFRAGLGVSILRTAGATGVCIAGFLGLLIGILAVMRLS